MQNIELLFMDFLIIMIGSLGRILKVRISWSGIWRNYPKYNNLNLVFREKDSNGTSTRLILPFLAFSLTNIDERMEACLSWIADDTLMIEKDGGSLRSPLVHLRCANLEVIQPQVLLRLPCYDFFPVAILMLGVPLRTYLVQGPLP